MNSSEISNLIANTIALSNGQIRWIELPKGVHTIDATISIEPNNITIDCSGCTLNVTGTHSAFRLRGQRDEIIRGRFIRTATTEPADPMFRIENTYCALDTVQIDCGGAGVGVQVRALAGELDSAGNQRFAYYSRIESCLVQKCSTAIQLAQRSNMARVIGCHGSHVNDCFVHCDGSIGCVVAASTLTGGQSSSYQPVIVRLSQSVDGGEVMNSQHNRIDISGEPGGTSYPYVIAQWCNHNQLFMQSNCSNGGTDNGFSNWIVYRGDLTA